MPSRSAPLSIYASPGVHQHLALLHQARSDERRESLEDDEVQFVREFALDVDVSDVVPTWLWGVCAWCMLQFMAGDSSERASKLIIEVPSEHTHP